MTDLLTLRTRIKAPAEQVFAALTGPSALQSWLAERAEVDLDAGQYTFGGRFTPQGGGGQRLTGAEPGRRVAFEWTLDDQPTTVTLDLSSTDRGGTALVLTQNHTPSLDELMNPPGRRDGLHAMHTFWPLALANLAAYAEGRELTPKADFSPARSLEITVKFSVDATAAEAFASLIDPLAVERWFGWKPEIEARPGGRMAVGVDGRIFEFEPGRRLGYGDDEGSIVRWELEGSGGKTHLTFVQSGYAEADDAAQHEAGWLAAFAELKRLHELGDDWQPLTTELPAKPDDD